MFVFFWQGILDWRWPTENEWEWGVPINRNWTYDADAGRNGMMILDDRDWGWFFRSHDCLVVTGGHEFGIFPWILAIGCLVIPIDLHSIIFQRGGEKPATRQVILVMVCCCIFKGWFSWRLTPVMACIRTDLEWGICLEIVGVHPNSLVDVGGSCGSDIFCIFCC